MKFRYISWSFFLFFFFFTRCILTNVGPYWILNTGCRLLFFFLTNMYSLAIFYWTVCTLVIHTSIQSAYIVWQEHSVSDYMQVQVKHQRKWDLAETLTVVLFCCQTADLSICESADLGFSCTTYSNVYTKWLQHLVTGCSVDWNAFVMWTIRGERPEMFELQ